MTITREVKPELTQPDRNGLVNQAARSVKWSILYNVVPRLVTPFSTIILAGLLTPADFGLVAISTFVLALAQIVVDMGLGKAVIRAQENVEESASISMWVSLSVSSIMCATLWLLAPWISTIYKNEQVTNVIRVVSFSLILSGSMVVPKALMRRNLEFNRLFWVYSSFLITQAILSVVFAMLGFGAWSIILGQLIGMGTSVWFAWKGEPWRPQLVKNWKLLLSMLKFSFWVMVSGFQEWLFTYADNVIAGLFLGVQGLGIYALGYNIATIIPGFLASSLGDVAYPTFCKIQEDVREVGKSLVGLQRLTGAILFPVAFGISAIAVPLIQLMYDQKWPNLGIIVAILVIMPGLSSIWSLNDTAYQAIGKPNTSAKIAGFNLLILIPVLWFSAPYGLLFFTIIRFAGAWIRPLGNIFWGFRILKVSLKEQIKALAAPLIYSLLMFGIVFFLTHQLSPFSGFIGWIKLAASIFVGAMVYITLIWFGSRDLWMQLIMSARRILSKAEG